MAQRVQQGHLAGLEPHQAQEVAVAAGQHLVRVVQPQLIRAQEEVVAAAAQVQAQAARAVQVLFTFGSSHNGALLSYCCTRDC